MLSGELWWSCLIRWVISHEVGLVWKVLIGVVSHMTEADYEPPQSASGHAVGLNSWRVCPVPF